MEELQNTTPPASLYPFRIEASPEFAMLQIDIPADHMVKVEASAMASMTTNVQMRTKFKGGFGRFLSKESLFINEFHAQGGMGELSIAPGPAGDIAHFLVEPEHSIILTGGAYVASHPNVTIDTQFQGLVKGFFNGESMFMMRCSGHGDVWFNSYGAIIPIDVDGEYTIDNGHLVAFTDGLQYDITKLGGYKSLFFSGEGLVCRFHGRGRVWMQTRNAVNLVGWAHGYRPARSG